MRGACALSVFLAHWNVFSDFTPHGPLEQGVQRAAALGLAFFSTITWPAGASHPALVCFFVLSGFCIHYPFAWRVRTGGEAPDWPSHYRRRFLRIMPVYWTAALLGLAFVLIEQLYPSGNVVLALHASATPGDALARLTGLSAFYPKEIFAGNLTLNNIAVEMVMYAAYPLFYYCAYRGSWVRLGAVFLALHLATIPLVRYVTPFWVFNSVPMLGVFWYAGAWAADHFVGHSARLPARWPLLAWLGFLSLQFVPHFFGLSLIRQAVWGLVCTLGILWMLGWETLRPQWSPGPMAAGLRYVGRISYSLHTVHPPIMMLVTWALLRAGQRDYLVQFALLPVVAVGASLLVHYGIERRYYRPRT